MEQLFWDFARRRQAIYYARLRGEPGPWTDDPILSNNRFTNVFRASDRVSQELIRVQEAGPQYAEDIALRTLVFKVFNKPETFHALGRLTCATWDPPAVVRELDEIKARGETIYNGAYMMRDPSINGTGKHRNHIDLIDRMVLPIAAAMSRGVGPTEMYLTLSQFDGIGPFLAFQYMTDLGYSAVWEYDENEFVSLGPGSRRGLQKMFPGERPSAAQVHGLQARMPDDAPTLFGRRPHLIDVQNLLCEFDKYLRQAQPELGARPMRIKRRFTPDPRPLPEPYFPPKWGLNDTVRAYLAEHR